MGDNAMGKIIDITERLKNHNNRIHSNNPKVNPKVAATAVTATAVRIANITNITKIREEMIQAERRIAKRVILNGFIGAHVVVQNKGLMRVNLYDFSLGGLSFDVPIEAGHFKEGEELPMRFYFNQETYFPFFVRVANSRTFENEGVNRHGALFSKNGINREALDHFVKFLESVSTALKTDKGDILVSGLGM
jgi:hypothetical protein